MVYKVKTFTRVDLDLRPNTVSLTLSKGYGTKSSGIPQQLLRDQFERLKVLLSQRKRNLKGMRYVFQSQLAAPSKQHHHTEMSVAALLIASLKAQINQPIEQFHFIGSFDLQGQTIALDYPQEHFVAALLYDCEFLVMPLENAKDVPEELASKVIGIRTLDELIDFVFSGKFRPISRSSDSKKNTSELGVFYNHVHASRALELAIVGRHHLLMFGQPGIGKSMLIDQYARVLPPLSSDQKMKVWPLHVKRKKPLINHIPIEYMKMNTTVTELYGGGPKPYPGYISLAHDGLLVADEIDQYSRALLEALKMALEWGEVLLEKHHYSTTYPSAFTLIGSCNTDLEQTDNGLFSDSFLDRIDLVIKLHKPDMSNSLDVFNYQTVSARLEQALAYKSDFQSSMPCAQPLECLEKLPFSKEALALVDRLKCNERSSVRRINRWLTTSLSLLFIDQKTIIDENVLLEALSFRKVL
jgi:magnesium chelatase family protein